MSREIIDFVSKTTEAITEMKNTNASLSRNVEVLTDIHNRMLATQTEHNAEVRSEFGYVKNTLKTITKTFVYLIVSLVASIISLVGGKMFFK